MSVGVGSVATLKSAIAVLEELEREDLRTGVWISRKPPGDAWIEGISPLVPSARITVARGLDPMNADLIVALRGCVPDILAILRRVEEEAKSSIWVEEDIQFYWQLELALAGSILKAARP